MDLADQIIEWEEGQLTETQTAALFQNLTDSGLVWMLEGKFGREATRLIEAGKVTR